MNVMPVSTQDSINTSLQWLLHNKIASEVLVSGTSVCCASAVTNPIDVIKTRLQLRPAGVEGPQPGLFGTGASVVRHEGVLALWKGLAPSMIRGMAYGGLRLGLYNPIKDAIHQAQPSSSSNSSTGSIANGSSSSTAVAAADVSTKLLAGICSGSIAAALLSPTELCKVRLQAANSPYRSASAVISGVIRSDGITGLWKGATPGVVRAAVLTASQCATYDEVKRRIMAFTGWRDGALTHLATAMVAGVISTTATNPVDVIKTHMFVGGRQHSGPISCARHLYELHGVSAFWRGWLANYARLGPQTVVTFLVVEQLRQLVGMKPLGS